MKAQELTQTLEKIAVEGIPSDIDLWPALQARTQAGQYRVEARPQADAKRLRLAFIPLAVLLAFVVVVLALGPQRVWADIQRLLGYVPGVGFANLEQTRILAAPVAVTRDGVTVRIEQAIAGPQGTQIVLRSDGLPPEYANQGTRGGGGDADIGVKLRLPNGETLAPTEWSLRYGAATFMFPALPAGVNQVALEIARLPLAPANVAPENWSIAFAVQPATGPLVAERFPQSYRPENTKDAHAGITARVLEVAHSADETAVRVQVTWDDPRIRIRDVIGGRYLPVLRDDRGRSYRYAPPSGIGSAVGKVVQPQPSGVSPVPTAPGGSVETVLTFAPLLPGARTLTLELDGMDTEAPAEGQFTLDLGEHPVVGDRWPLDVTLNVAGFPVHLSGAGLVEEEIRLRDGAIKRTNLEFDVDPVAGRDGLNLRGFSLNAGSPAFNGSGGGYNFDTNRIRVSVHLKDGATVPPGPLTFNVVGASVVQSGPWRLTWDLPAVAAGTR